MYYLYTLEWVLQDIFWYNSGQMSAFELKTNENNYNSNIWLKVAYVSQFDFFCLSFLEHCASIISTNTDMSILDHVFFN